MLLRAADTNSRSLGWRHILTMMCKALFSMQTNHIPPPFVGLPCYSVAQFTVNSFAPGNCWVSTLQISLGEMQLVLSALIWSLPDKISAATRRQDEAFNGIKWRRETCAHSTNFVLTSQGTPRHLRAHQLTAFITIKTVGPSWLRVCTSSTCWHFVFPPCGRLLTC